MHPPTARRPPLRTGLPGAGLRGPGPGLTRTGLPGPGLARWPGGGGNNNSSTIELIVVSHVILAELQQTERVGYDRCCSGPISVI